MELNDKTVSKMSLRQGALIYFIGIGGSSMSGLAEMRHEHGTGCLAVDGDRKVFKGLHIQQHISVVIRGTQHTRIGGHERTPLLGGGITALLIGITC